MSLKKSMVILKEKSKTFMRKRKNKRKRKWETPC